MQHIWNEIVEKLKKFFHDTGFTKAVIGGSGGIDSSVVICLAAEALGPENVLVAMMPSYYSSKGSITDTLDLCTAWNVLPVSISITPTLMSLKAPLANVDQLIRDFSGASKAERTFTEENIQARIRMILLMAISNEHNCLVLNTCNKSEDYTGYATLYGDSCGAIAPIGDLYKTDVYLLARWINDNPELPNIPEVILQKPPSAELSEGQLDTDSLPPYEVLDPILDLCLNKVSQEAVAMSYPPHIVKEVFQLVKSSAYKRAQSAPVLKLKDRDIER